MAKPAKAKAVREAERVLGAAMPLPFQVANATRLELASLQPYVSQAATLCIPGCNPMYPRLQPYVSQLAWRSLAGPCRFCAVAAASSAIARSWASLTWLGLGLGLG